MKTTTFIFFCFTLALFSSCKKSYVCSCSEFSTSYAMEATYTGHHTEYEIKSIRRKAAIDDCHNHGYENKTTNISMSCHLK